MQIMIVLSDLLQKNAKGEVCAGDVSLDITGTVNGQQVRGWLSLSGKTDTPYGRVVTLWPADIIGEDKKTVADCKRKFPIGPGEFFPGLRFPA